MRCFILIMFYQFVIYFFFFNDTATTEIYTLSLHDALPIYSAVPSPSFPDQPVCQQCPSGHRVPGKLSGPVRTMTARLRSHPRSEEHTSELQSRLHLVCRLLLEKKKTNIICRYSSVATHS